MPRPFLSESSEGVGFLFGPLLEEHAPEITSAAWWQHLRDISDELNGQGGNYAPAVLQNFFEYVGDEAVSYPSGTGGEATGWSAKTIPLADFFDELNEALGQ